MKSTLLSKITLIIILGLTVLSCSKEDEPLIEVDKTKIDLLNNGTEVQLIINSNVDWSSSLDGDKEGIQYSPTSGKSGTTQVSVKASPNAGFNIRDAILSITSKKATATVQIKQAPLTFSVSHQTLIFTTDETSKELFVNTDVSWKITNKNWPEWVDVSPLSGKENGMIQISVTDKTKCINTSFELTFGYEGKQISIPVIFNVDGYPDGGYTVYQRSQKAKPIKLIFTGDGYLPEHFNYGGLFDQNADEAIEALFAIEPYKTFREYFSVYKIAAYSRETGISSMANGMLKNTAFSCTLTGGTGIAADYDRVFSYALLPPDITDSDLMNTSICVIINANTYAGTCYMISNGKSIAMVPVSRPKTPSYTAQFPNIVHHEFGGHGFGRLADEYMTYDKMIPDEEKKQLILWQGYNYYMNVSPYDTAEKVPWNRFIGAQEYPQVGIFEGGFNFTLGVTRPEEISCMDDNRPYFNAQSRYLIMERILQAAGEEKLTYQEFLKKDVQKTPPAFTRSLSREKDFVPLAPPIRVMQ